MSVIDKRESNLELLRIISMLAIVVYHACWHTRFFFDEQSTIISELFCSFIIYHVSLFVLISGFFGIKMKAKSILKIVLPCFFIGLFFNLASTFILNKSASIKDYILLFVPFISSKWWFVTSYVQLMIASPILNFINRSTNIREHLLVVAIFSFICFTYGGIFHSDFDATGQSAFHFAFLYEVGSLIKKYILNRGPIDIKVRPRLLCIYLLCVCFIFLKYRFEAMGITPPYSSYITIQ